MGWVLWIKKNCKRLMRENIFKNSHIIQKTLFIYKGLLFQLKGFGNFH